MMNQYPLWKYLLIMIVIAAGAIYAAPNLYGEDPAVQISALRGNEVNERTLRQLEALMERREIKPKSIVLDERGVLIRFSNTDEQLKAQDEIRDFMGRGYVVALNLAPSTPEWLAGMNALPMYLGLDLRGGVHFLMEVDMEAAVKQAFERYRGDFRTTLREEKVRYLSIKQTGLVNEGNARIELHFRKPDEREKARKLLSKSFSELNLKEDEDDRLFYLYATIPPAELQAIQKFAIQQNITTLRNRVNELGVAEPVIQQQGVDRIVVQLPGVQDTARAKEILGATATLEFRMVNEERDAASAASSGNIPFGTELYRERNGSPILLKSDVMLTGDYIVDASSGIDQQSGGAAVFISLDGKGGRIFTKETKNNVGRLMAVVFINTESYQQKNPDGSVERMKKKTKEVINVARIRERLGSRFQITGLDSTSEAHDLALLLRAGALAAPIDIVEERTVGPSLGQDNIDQGMSSVVIGFVLVLALMAFYYKGFGLVANLALGLNLVLIIAVLSLMQATLTLPGIAGIVLTVGMAVDANVLIFERIREEMRAGVPPQSAIDAGYGKAFITIADANITTLIAAIVLFALGTGPIKGFAVTLSIGILTSMFTAILVSRGVVNLIYGRRKVKKLSI